ncbi:homocysteine S-methyltransferase [Fructilactobacillus lindneri]|uniref:Homocysteine S-methyltransferase n=2 Tax=Fructilactobacillus lindneri TaxID=53444 RepID=A0A0R2JQD1_9LACO|nr:homocysteine S-methyltransferase [Fructilactobacillus lindneri]ANZ57291.1 homocysteine S-methyltransferase [Fructilactobacillus lindneri]ANZ58556.1 homocysteine S-methyltransferase [Fructilactobacillus lindneri]KRN79326.1 Homocysteine S-methyltransferase [Fructilactobacillus lindneri DSM 20690 = JCM 11027]POG98403.1 homocysteine S-methyltransferase [Fructilactobacillus lindneri]POH03802.1 homocysteine S-methyltransferase [Fructilactobacillus lindneri]
MTKEAVKQRLKQRLVLDGAMGTELEKLGVKTNDELWSANALIDNPEAIYQVHASYFKAGADIAITDTYQANVAAFAKNGIKHDEAIELIKSGVKIAKQARDDYDSNGLIAGCIGPYGAYLANGAEYTGNYELSFHDYQNFHQEKIKALIDAGSDLLSIDTIPNFQEVKALVKIINDLPNKLPYWISLSVKDVTKLGDGTDLKVVIKWLSQQDNIDGIGVNCTKIENITPIVNLIRDISNLPIVVYPNPGDIYHPKTKTWTTVPHVDTFQQEVPNWLSQGANIIGGCCRTTPEDIAQIAKILKN